MHLYRMAHKKVSPLQFWWQLHNHIIMVSQWAPGKTHNSAVVDKVVFYQFCQQCTETKKPICTLTDTDIKTRLLFHAPLCRMEVYEHHCQYYFVPCCNASISVHLKSFFLVQKNYHFCGQFRCILLKSRV